MYLLFLTFSCNNTTEKPKETKVEKVDEQTVINENNVLLVVNYELQDMTLEEHSELGSDVVSNFSSWKINGLIGKTFIDNIDDGIFGGIYYFKNQVDLNSYLSSELWKGIDTHPNLANFKTDTYGVASISLISNGVPAL